jgi:hypothetical protein
MRAPPIVFCVDVTLTKLADVTANSTRRGAGFAVYAGQSSNATSSAGRSIGVPAQIAMLSFFARRLGDVATSGASGGRWTRDRHRNQLVDQIGTDRRSSARLEAFLGIVASTIPS